MSKSGDGHLAPGTREQLQLGDDARIASMQSDRWIVGADRKLSHF